MARAGRIGRFFTDGVTVDPGAPYRSMSGREGIVGFAASVPVPEGGVRVELLDVRVSLDIGGAAAFAAVTARVTGLDPMTREQRGDVRELALRLVRIDGEWLIDTVEAVRAIEPPLR